MTKRHLDNLPTSIRFGLRRLLLRQLIPPFRVRLKDLVTIRRDAAGIHILSVSFQGLLRHPIQGAPEFHACYMVRDEMSSSPVDVRDHPSELSEPCCVRRCWARISHTPEKSSLLSSRRISSNAVMDVALRQPDPFHRELTRWIRRLRCC